MLDTSHVAKIRQKEEAKTKKLFKQKHSCTTLEFFSPFETTLSRCSVYLLLKNTENVWHFFSEKNPYFSLSDFESLFPLSSGDNLSLLSRAFAAVLGEVFFPSLSVVSSMVHSGGS